MKGEDLARLSRLEGAARERLQRELAQVERARLAELERERALGAQLGRTRGALEDVRARELVARDGHDVRALARYAERLEAELARLRAALSEVRNRRDGHERERERRRADLLQTVARGRALSSLEARAQHGQARREEQRCEEEADELHLARRP